MCVGRHVTVSQRLSSLGISSVDSSTEAKPDADLFDEPRRTAISADADTERRDIAEVRQPAREYVSLHAYMCEDSHIDRRIAMHADTSRDRHVESGRRQFGTDLPRQEHRCLVGVTQEHRSTLAKATYRP